MRLFLVVMVAVAVTGALGACGKKAALEPPPTTSVEPSEYTFPRD